MASRCGASLRGKTGGRADLDDAERQDPAIVLADRKVFAGTKDVVAEAMNCLVVIQPRVLTIQVRLAAVPFIEVGVSDTGPEYRMR